MEFLYHSKPVDQGKSSSLGPSLDVAAAKVAGRLSLTWPHHM